MFRLEGEQQIFYACENWSTTELLPIHMPEEPYFLLFCHDYESKGRGFESRRAHFPETLIIKRFGDFFIFSRIAKNTPEYPPKTDLLPSYYRADFWQNKTGYLL